MRLRGRGVRVTWVAHDRARARAREPHMAHNMRVPRYTPDMAILNNQREIKTWMSQARPQRVDASRANLLLKHAPARGDTALRNTSLLGATQNTPRSTPRITSADIPNSAPPSTASAPPVPRNSAEFSSKKGSEVVRTAHNADPNSKGNGPLFSSTQLSDFSDFESDAELINPHLLGVSAKTEPKLTLPKVTRPEFTHPRNETNVRDTEARPKGTDTHATKPHHKKTFTGQVQYTEQVQETRPERPLDLKTPSLLNTSKPAKRPGEVGSGAAKKPRTERNSCPSQNSNNDVSLLHEYIRMCETKINLLTKLNAINDSTSLSLDAKKLWHAQHFEPKLDRLDLSLLRLRPSFSFLDPPPRREDLSNISDLSSAPTISQNKEVPLEKVVSESTEPLFVQDMSSPEPIFNDLQALPRESSVQVPDALAPNYSSNIQEARQIIMEQKGKKMNNVPVFTAENESEDEFGEGFMAGLQLSQIDNEDTDLSGFIAPEEDTESIDGLYVAQPTQFANDTEEDDILENSESERELENIRLSQDVAQRLGVTYDSEPIEILDDERENAENTGDFTTQLNEGRDEIVEIPSEDDLDDVDLDGLKELTFIKSENPENLHVISDSDFSDDDDELIQLSKSVGSKNFDEPFLDEVYKVLRQNFRLSEFRSNQLEAVVATLKGKDVFVLIPTGGGKSLCFQLPALVKGGRTRGTTVVVSPLISLMQDQVQHLQEKNIRAGMISSKGTADERNTTFKALTSGQLDLVYLSPEMINNSGRVQKVISKLHENSMLSRVVVDEAHCVSSWGHDFRPDYKGMSFFKQNFPDVPIMALTATANEKVRLDIVHNLQMNDPVLLKQSFNRVNLFYEVKNKPPSIFEWIKEYIYQKHRGKTGIIYCHLKQSCETTAQKLTEYGVQCMFYHAGMDPNERFEVQEKWQKNQIQVICATIAFGMGIDKPDVRFVIHMYIPRSLEGYYQETGRAGRDGNESECIMFYSYKDARALQSLIQRDDKLEDSAREAHLMKLQQVVQYCENKTDCRRRQVLHFFNENFNAKDCKKMCDNCCSNITSVSRDVTQHCVAITKLVQSLQNDKVTIIHCQDVYKGARHGKILKQSHHQNPFHGLGKDLDRGDIERIFYHLQSEGGLLEYQVMRGGFASTYVKLGPRANVIMKGTQKIELSFAEKQKSNHQSLRSKVQAFKGPDSFVSARNLDPDAFSGTSYNSGSFTRISLPEQNFNGQINESNSELVNYAFTELRNLRAQKSLELGYGRAHYFISEALLKEMALKLPANAVDFAKLEAITKKEIPYFQYFKKLLGSLSRSRKKASLDASQNSVASTVTESGSTISEYSMTQKRTQKSQRSQRKRVTKAPKTQKKNLSKFFRAMPI